MNGGFEIMGIQISIPTRIIEFSKEQYNDWVNGKRDDCPEGYCKGLPNSYGFGEYIAGQFYALQGYQWIHHDFNIFGGNKLGKYPHAQEILIKYLGIERFEKLRLLYPTFKPLEEPDLFIYKSDFSEIRFVEAKRVDTNDKLRESQIRGLALINLLMGCSVEVFEILEKGKAYTSKPVIWEF
jgi:hypothetical protein